MTGRCGACSHFANDGATLEEAFPGLASMSSGYASVRGDDGICQIQSLYLPARSGCGRFSKTVRMRPPGLWQTIVDNLLAKASAARSGSREWE